MSHTGRVLRLGREEVAVTGGEGLADGKIRATEFGGSEFPEAFRIR